MWSLPFHLIKKFACLIMTREQKEDFIKLTEILLSSEEENWLTTQQTLPPLWQCSAPSSPSYSSVRLGPPCKLLGEHFILGRIASLVGLRSIAPEGEGVTSSFTPIISEIIFLSKNYPIKRTPALPPFLPAFA